MTQRIIHRAALAGAFVIFGFVLLMWAVSRMVVRAGNTPQHLWESNLLQFGYPARQPETFEPNDMAVWLHQGIAFTGLNTVATFFVARDNPVGKPTEQAQQSSSSAACRLVAVFLNADNGELIRKLEWPLLVPASSVASAFLFPATNGRFVVVIGPTLLLYSPDFKLLERYDAQSEFLAIASPAGDTIFLYEPQRAAGLWTSRFALLDTDRLSVRKSWDDNSPLPSSYVGLWGDELAWISSGALSFEKVGQDPKISRNSLYFQKAGEPPKKVLDSKKEFCGYGSFIKKDTIALADCGERELLIVSTDGQVIREIRLGSEEMYGPAMAAHDGRRFAVQTYQWGFGRNKIPRKLVSRVFDLDTEAPLLTVDFPRYSDGGPFAMPMGNTQYGPRGAALSPDGELLGVKAGPIVQLYQVPEHGGTSLSTQQKTSPAVARTATELPKAGPATSSQVALQLAQQQALSWLPADTQTIFAANGPFSLPELQAPQTPGPEASDHDVEDVFKGLPLGLFSFHQGFLEKYFKEEEILFALEGSRHFRPPTGLGMAPYEGCDVAVFAADITSRANSFLKDASKNALRLEQIDGHEVAVFQEKMEEDTWTTFVAFPKPNVALAATNEQYLQQILARLDGRNGERALPDNLPEWKHVHVHARFWALRHYDKHQAALDPTLPIGGGRAGNVTDDQAIGLTFSFDPANSKAAILTYLSADKNIYPNVQKNLFPVESEPGAKEMHIRYHEVEPGVVEGSYDLANIESAQLFAFVLENLLGHAIYL